jgi:predicted dehydrogenase
MTNHVRWGVLGAAGFARKTMAPAIHAATRSEFTALATRNPDKAAAFVALAPGVKLHDNYDALLADPAIDAVYIPLPNAMHVDWSVRAAQAGKHVLCEKPIGLHADDFDRLIAARDATGQMIAEAWMPAHHPQWAKMRDLIAQGAIGHLHSVTGHFSYGLGDAGNIRLNSDLGGGALRDVGVYPIGTFRFATGLEPQIIWADAILENGVDSSAWVQARAGDVRFSFHVSMRTTREQGMVFYGDRGSIQCTAPFNAGEYAEAQLIVKQDGADTRVIRFPTAQQYVSQVEAMAAHILDGVNFPYGLEQSRGTQAVIDAVFAQLGV